jgi:hypothetical protein
MTRVNQKVLDAPEQKDLIAEFGMINQMLKINSTEIKKKSLQ